MKIANDLEIFLDEFGASRQQDDARPCIGRGKQGAAKMAAVGAVKIKRLAADWSRIRRDFDKPGYRELSRVRRAITLMSPAIERRPDK